MVGRRSTRSNPRNPPFTPPPPANLAEAIRQLVAALTAPVVHPDRKHLVYLFKDKTAYDRIVEYVDAALLDPAAVPPAFMPQLEELRAKMSYCYTIEDPIYQRHATALRRAWAIEAALGGHQYAREPEPLDDDDKEILTTLARKQTTRLQYQLALEIPMDRKQLGKRLKVLIGAGLVILKGIRKGYALTEAGRSWVKRNCPEVR